MFLLNISYSTTPAQVEPHIKGHSEWVVRHLNEGVILFAGPKKSGLGGIIAVGNISKEQLLNILAQDPYVQADVCDVQISDFTCKLAQPALQSLLD